MVAPLIELRVGIVGTGNMGTRHARAYKYHEPRTRLVACYDLRPESARAFAERFRCTVEDSLETLLARRDIDAVSICTTEEHHRVPVCEAAKAGKHILVEKPMAITLEDALAMKKAAQEAGVRLMVGHLYRFDRRSAAVKQAIAAGEIGPLHSIHCAFHGIPAHQDRIKNLPLSIATFRGCHAIDLMRWFSGSEVCRVYAEDVQGIMRAKGYHSEDAMFCLLRFRNGAVGSMELNSVAPESHPTQGKAEIRLAGTLGVIELDYAQPWYKQSDAGGFHHRSGDRKDLWFREEIAAFLNVVLHDEPSLATADDAIAALRVSLAAEQSARTHLPVELV